MNQEFPFTASPGNQLYIKLETDGDSSSGSDSCFYDNVYLYGQGSNGNTASPATQWQPIQVFGDTMQDLNNWSISPDITSDKITEDNTALCTASDYDCIRVQGVSNTSFIYLY